MDGVSLSFTGTVGANNADYSYATLADGTVADLRALVRLADEFEVDPYNNLGVVIEPSGAVRLQYTVRLHL